MNEDNLVSQSKKKYITGDIGGDWGRIDLSHIQHDDLIQKIKSSGDSKAQEITTGTHKQVIPKKGMAKCGVCGTKQVKKKQVSHLVQRTDDGALILRKKS